MRKKENEKGERETIPVFSQFGNVACPTPGRCRCVDRVMFGSWAGILSLVLVLVLCLIRIFCGVGYGVFAGFARVGDVLLINLIPVCLLRRSLDFVQSTLGHIVAVQRRW